jgi:hypothetical protein
VSDLSPIAKALIVTIGVLIIVIAAIYFRYGTFDANIPLLAGTGVVAFALSFYGFNRQD